MEKSELSVVFMSIVGILSVVVMIDAAVISISIFLFVLLFSIIIIIIIIIININEIIIK